MNAYIDGQRCSTAQAVDRIRRCAYAQGHDMGEIESIIARAMQGDGESERDVLLDFGVEFVA